MLTPMWGPWGLLPVGSSQGDGRRGAGVSLLVERGAPWSGGDVPFTVSRENSLGWSCQGQLRGTGRARPSPCPGAAWPKGFGSRHLQAAADETLRSLQG